MVISRTRERERGRLIATQQVKKQITKNSLEKQRESMGRRKLEMEKAREREIKGGGKKSGTVRQITTYLVAGEMRGFWACLA